jgi:L-Lysine epsilon oxidase N-terminal/L-lysine epsilon oxidase C-terminal domain
MATTYKIHPGIGIARLGNAPEDFCISPEAPAALPIDCDSRGNPLLSPDGTAAELPVSHFKDAEGRIRRQAARFQVYVYDDESPQGRPLKLGDPVSGGGNQGLLVDIQWRAYLANKKASWYEFQQLAGEHGYAPDHPRRNAGITAPEARQRLIVDPGPRIVDCTRSRTARFGRDGGDVYAPAFPPPLEPCSIDTLGELKTDDAGRLLVLGGHGCSGSFLADEFGQPRIDDYANNDGWFDDTADGPVTARLVMYSPEVDRTRFVDVEYPAWVLVGYPAYVPQILDVVTLAEVVEDLGVRQFASRPEIYGLEGTFDCPELIDPADVEALILWRAGRLRWNPAYRPWFHRDIWPILFRADQFTYLTTVLGNSNYPHNQSRRGNFDPWKLGMPPRVDRDALERCQKECLARHHSGRLFVEMLAPALELLGKQDRARQLRLGGTAPAGHDRDDRVERFVKTVRKAVERFVREVMGEGPGADARGYLERWREAAQGSPEDKEALEAALDKALEDLRAGGAGGETWEQFRVALSEQLGQLHSGKLLEDCLARCVETCTRDPYRAYRRYLFDLLRQSGEENNFRVGSKPSSRVHGLPLMPLLAGDNPLSNELPSKFLRLTDLQYYLLRQWASGLFYNEDLEGWAHPDPWRPYAGWVKRTGGDLDRGVLSNLLGGAFCPGGEIGWIIRNPSIYLEPFRVKADPSFSSFRQTAAQANANRAAVPEADYSAYVEAALSQNDNFDRGMQPGDLTKHMALPWQSDFNECTSQPINVTYEQWNRLYPGSEKDTLMKREEAVWETLWWPAHRPLQVWEPAPGGGFRFVDWSRGVPQTNAGDLKMATEWWRLAFVRQNPQASEEPTEVPPPNIPPFVAVERTTAADGKQDEGEEATPAVRER